MVSPLTPAVIVTGLVRRLDGTAAEAARAERARLGHYEQLCKTRSCSDMVHGLVRCRETFAACCCRRSRRAPRPFCVYGYCVSQGEFHVIIMSPRSGLASCARARHREERAIHFLASRLRHCVRPCLLALYCPFRMSLASTSRISWGTVGPG